MIGLHEQLETALAGRYQVERELGRGGMAVVYLARDVRHDRRVAVKVLRPELATSLGAERFLREISVAAGLNHPNIVPLYDSGESDDLLYYVMPHVEGESLRDRLERERQLPIDEAIAIARQVAEALDYAHARGVVHRDVKPENVLLRGDHVMVADFGLARALYTASNSRLTRSGMAVGTPAYMSPEQAAGEDHVDGRSDVYALGCVVFELIAGVSPFRGATAQAVIAHHVSSAPPSLCRERSSCPPSVDAAVRRALAKTPADRFRTAGEFVRVLSASSNGATWEPGTVVRRASRGGAVVVAGTIALIGTLGVSYALARRGALDESRYVVLPFASDVGTTPGASDGGRATEHLSDAVAEWQGLRVVDRQRVLDELDERRRPVRRRRDALAVARQLGAGRLLWGDMTVSRDTTTARVSLYDVEKGVELRRYAIRYAAADPTPVQQYRELASALLRGRTEIPWRDARDTRPASLPAWVTYDSGRVALAAWDLDAAARYFRAATAADADHAQAQVWLAQTLAWSRPDQPGEWLSPAARAVALSAHLSVADSLLAHGLLGLATQRFPDACAAFRRLRDIEPDWDVAWYGIGYCLGVDPFVLRDPRSPSGWRFRGSTHSAAAAYDSAIQRARGAPAFAFRMLDALLITGTNRTRRGVALPPGRGLFQAYPSVQGDSLAFVPHPAAEFEAGAGRIARSSIAEALRRNLVRLRSTFAEWVRRDPHSAEAYQALARLQEALGERRAVEGGGLTALATLATARHLSKDPVQRLRIAADEVRVLVKDEQFGAAHVLGDSLLATVRPAGAREADILAGVAALIGRVDRTADLLRTRARADPRVILATDFDLHPAISDAAATLLAFASFGVCSDTLATLRANVERLIERFTSESHRAAARRAALGRSTSLAVPCLGPATVVDLAVPDRLVRIQRALAEGRRAAVRAHFDTLRHLRRGERQGDISLDHTVQEAWILTALGDSAGATRHLDLALAALPALPTQLTDDVPQAAALGRAMILRAELAAAAGDRATAQRWASRLLSLWAGASPALQHATSRMRQLAAKASPLPSPAGGGNGVQKP